MKARKYFAVMVLLVAIALTTVGCSANNSTVDTSSSTKEATTDGKKNEKLKFDKWYIVMPAMDLRKDPDTPGKIDSLVVGDEVEFIRHEGEWAVFKYKKDGEERTGCTWISAIAPGVRIHLIEDEFIFRQPWQTTEEVGAITMWREPSDPDLIILWQEYDGWYYVVSMEDCRSGYMSPEAKFEIVE